MAKYNSEAKKIIAEINREAKRRYGSGGYSKAEKAKIKSAYQTGRVESNFTNSSNMTDHDSQGWRQERASLYKDPTNLKNSTRRYFDEADKHYRPGMKSGDLAANVQRPAAQYRSRYAQHNRESESLFKGLRGARSAVRSSGGGEQAPEAPMKRSDALSALIRESALNPSGATALTGTNIASALLQDAAGGGGEEAPTPKAKARSKTPTGADPWKAALAAGATVSSARRPGAITAAGNPSDHGGAPGSGTMARDFVGPDMDKIARTIAKSLGIKNYKGGLINHNKGGYRYQLIWKAAGHYDHVHLGRKKI